MGWGKREERRKRRREERKGERDVIRTVLCKY